MPENSQDPKSKRSLFGCLFTLLLLVAAVVGVLWVVQQYVTPDVADEGGVTIAKQDPDTESSPEVEKQGSQDQRSTIVPAGPVRITDAISPEIIAAADHPLDPLMKLADDSLKIIDEKYQDYTVRIVSQVRTNVLNDETVMLVKLRHQRAGEDGEDIPFSIFTRFLSPKSKVGHEAIWVKDKNDGKILGHATGLLNFKTIGLDPDGSYAMQGNRYPIYQLGFRNLILKMKEFGENDRKYRECEVDIERGVMVGDRECVLLTIMHPNERKHFEYHIAKIYIDLELEIPIGYEGFLWPDKEGDEPPLLERYIYTELEVNCGLTDLDFDTANPDYDYPRF